MSGPSRRLVAIDARGYFTRGGIGRYTRNLVRELAAVGDPQLRLRLLISNRHAAPDMPLPKGAADVVVSRAAWGDLDEEAQWLPGEVADADLFHSLSGHAAPAGPPSVVTVHDITPWLFPSLVSDHIRQQFEAVRLALSRASAVITSSAATAADLQHLRGAHEHAAPVRTTRFAADPVFQPIAPSGGALQALGVEPGEFFLAVSVLAPHKNLLRLVQAYAGSHTPRPLVIVGADGWQSETLHHEVARLGLADRVRFAGRIDDVALAGLYSTCRAFIYPSLYEGFGLPVLEAMACGAAVICSSSSSLPEVAGDAALLVEPEAVDAIALAIARLDRDDVCRERLRRAGHARAARFTWARTARETVDVYREQLQMARGAQRRQVACSR